MNPAAQPTYQAVYRACMKEAASQGRLLMQRVVTRAGQKGTVFAALGVFGCVQMLPQESQR